MIANLLVAFLIPPTWMVLINTNSLSSAVNPFELLATIIGIGKSYLLLCFSCFCCGARPWRFWRCCSKVAAPGLVLPW